MESPPFVLEPAWRSGMPDWVLVMRATFGEPRIMREAAAEIQRRNGEHGARAIWLAADPRRHRALLEAALVAEDAPEARAA
jgi:hypothetical protein